MPTSPPAHNAPPIVTGLLAILGLVLIVTAAFYFTQTADQLPSFFPGHQAGNSHHHTRHGVAALLLGLLACIGAWMSAGKKTPRLVPLGPIGVHD